MRTLRYLVIIAAVMALATRLLGWWTVPVVAALAALLAGDRTARTSVTVTAAAVLAWGALLVLQDLFGSSVTGLGRDVATSLGVPAPVPLVLTLVLPAILAASAAGVVAGLRRWRRPAAP